MIFKRCMSTSATANRKILNITKSMEGKFKVGSSIIAERTISQQDIIDFSNVSYDYNPVHLDAKFVKEKTIYDKPIAHGMLCSTIFSSMFATDIPGCIYLNQNLQFKKPVFVDDKIRAVIEILKVKPFKRSKTSEIYECSTNVYKIGENDEQIQVIDGTGKVLLLKEH